MSNEKTLLDLAKELQRMMAQFETEKKSSDEEAFQRFMDKLTADLTDPNQ